MSCSSSSSVKRPLPPISERARSVIRSPLVERTTISNISSGRPWATIRRARVSSLRERQRAAACRYGRFVCIRTCPLLPTGFVDRFLRNRNQ